MEITIKLDDTKVNALPPILVALLPVLLDLVKKWLETRAGDGSTISPNP